MGPSSKGTLQALAWLGVVVQGRVRGLPFRESSLLATRPLVPRFLSNGKVWGVVEQAMNVQLTSKYLILYCYLVFLLLSLPLTEPLVITRSPPSQLCH